MKVLARFGLKALPEKRSWPLVRTQGLVNGGAVALSIGNAVVAGEPRFGTLGEHPRAWPEDRDVYPRAAINGDNVNVLSKKKFQVLAERNGWSLERARGYVDGETFRLRAKMPSRYALIGIDEYSLGFRAGYYERRNGA